MPPKNYKIRQNPDYVNFSRELDDRVVNPLAGILFLVEELDIGAEDRRELVRLGERILGVVREVQGREG